MAITTTILLRGKGADPHLKPPGDPHCTCTQVSGGRNGGGIVKRPVGVFVH